MSQTITCPGCDLPMSDGTLEDAEHLVSCGLAYTSDLADEDPSAWADNVEAAIKALLATAPELAARVTIEPRPEVEQEAPEVAPLTAAGPRRDTSGRSWGSRRLRRAAGSSSSARAGSE